MFTIGQIAKKFSLSRSTLIYYDSMGVVKPSRRTLTNYRVYSEDDIARLERVLVLRSAGMSIKQILATIDNDSDDIEKALEKRLFSINKEIQQLRKQQKLIIDMISLQGEIENTPIITEDKWVAMFKAAGLDEEGMWNWHIEYERHSPEGHQDFLESIGISHEEIADIRQRSHKKS